MLAHLLKKLVEDTDPLLEQRLRITREVDKIHQAMWGNRLVEIWYVPVDDVVPVVRLIEPYSFRRLPHGLMLYGWDVRERRTKSFYTDRIRSVRVQARTFTPKWDVEPYSVRALTERRGKNKFPFADAVLEKGDVVFSFTPSRLYGW